MAYQIFSDMSCLFRILCIFITILKTRHDNENTILFFFTLLDNLL